MIRRAAAVAPLAERSRSSGAVAYPCAVRIRKTRLLHTTNQQSHSTNQQSWDAFDSIFGGSATVAPSAAAVAPSFPSPAEFCPSRSLLIDRCDVCTRPPNVVESVPVWERRLRASAVARRLSHSAGLARASAGVRSVRGAAGAWRRRYASSCSPP